MLHDFVIGVLSTAADDVGGTRGLPESDSVLTNVFKPDIIDIAGALSVNALGLVSTDDKIPGESMVEQGW